MLKTNKQLLNDAEKRNYAVPAFNIYNLESIKAVAIACLKLNSPVIMQTTPNHISYGGIEYIYSLVKKVSEKIDVSLHLDHGKTLDDVKNCLDNGYTSVMIDGSALDLRHNIEITKKTVSMARKNKVSSEAELGTLGGIEDSVSGRVTLTDPKTAKEFVKKTKIDSLAVAIGTSHGAYKFKGRSRLDFERLKEINELVKIPLVLHGASGVPQDIIKNMNKFGGNFVGAHGVSDEHIKKAIKLGIRKINIDSDLRLAFTSGIREYLWKNRNDFDPRKILMCGQKYMQVVTEHKIKLFESKGKAKY